ncbi:MAG: rRNA maturation RNase YbeY [Bacteroidota bacterium]
MSIEHFPSFGDELNEITFSSEEVPFKLDNELTTGEWLKKVIGREEKHLRSLNFIFCSDDYLHRINIEYLRHDTYTDVITFHYAEQPFIEGDIFISVDRIKENAEKYNVSFAKELYRVMAHGVLHLCGYGDKTSDEKKEMRKKENEALELFRIQ